MFCDLNKVYSISFNCSKKRISIVRCLRYCASVVSSSGSREISTFHCMKLCAFNVRRYSILFSGDFIVGKTGRLIGNSRQHDENCNASRSVRAGRLVPRRCKYFV